MIFAIFCLHLFTCIPNEWFDILIPLPPVNLQRVQIWEFLEVLGPLEFSAGFWEHWGQGGVAVQTEAGQGNTVDLLVLKNVF